MEIQMGTGTEMMDKHTVIHMEEQLQEQGDKAINAMQKYKTAMSFDFVLPDKGNTYPIQDEFVKLLQVIQQKDSMMTVKETKGFNQWKVPNDIPTRE
eukprot:10915500-Ditylum_brightwellii.AAC.1